MPGGVKRDGEAQKPGRGRPSKYDPRFVKIAQAMTNLGATDREVAEALEIEERTLHRWKHDHPEFCQALKLGKEAADDRVEQSLYRRAVGYSFDAVKIFMPSGAKEPVYAAYVEHVPPDATSIIYWLKNRRRETWRDKTPEEATSPAEAAAQIMEVIRAANATSAGA